MIKLEHAGSGEIFYATRLSAGFDLCAAEEVFIASHEWALVKTGLRIVESLEVGQVRFGAEEYPCVPEIQIRPRSGLALHHGVTVLNSPSTIDADYRGEIMVTLINHSKQDFIVRVGDRIAQAVCGLSIRLPSVRVKDVERGQGGFGSSGRN